MNLNEKELERISAALDGEGADSGSAPGEAAGRQASYARLGDMLRSLPDPEVHPAFATRVLAHAREENARRSVWLPWRWLAPAAGLLAVAALAFVLIPDAQEPGTVSSPPEGMSIALREDWTNEEVVVEAMEELIDQGHVLELYPAELEAEETPEPVEPVEELGTEDWSESIARDVYAYVSDTYWQDSTEELLWTAPDYEDEYDALSPGQREAFEELMLNYRDQLS
ncbi:MAG: hypothetical protein RLZZ303_3386 [Candidatus Hydrogenedentota bacterium]